MTSNVNREQCVDILHDMLEQVGAYELLEEITSQMSTDQLNDVVKGLDQYLFENHYAQHFVN